MTCPHIDAGRRCIRRADHEPYGHITAPWRTPDPVCGQCDSRCPTSGDPDEHDDLGRGLIGKCTGCSCPQFKAEADR